MTISEKKVSNKCSAGTRFFIWAALLFFIAILLALFNVDINNHYEQTTFNIISSYEKVFHTESETGSSYSKRTYCKIQYEINDKIYTKSIACIILQTMPNTIFYYTRWPSISWFSDAGFNLWVNAIVAASLGTILMLAGIFPIKDDAKIMKGQERARGDQNV